MRPRLLDLFCGAGGAAVGYHRAGFDVVGVDINPQPHYPFEFHQGDAMTWPLDGYEIVHASPVCKAFTKTGWAYHFGYHANHVDLLTPTRARLEESGVPWVIENVPGAPMRVDVMLCGSQFGLGVRRHRWFELGFPFFSLMTPCDHRERVVSPHGHPNRFKGTAADWAKAMGIDWMTSADELAQAIPPAYCEFIGDQLLVFLRRDDAHRSGGSSLGRTRDISAFPDRRAGSRPHTGVLEDSASSSDWHPSACAVNALDGWFHYQRSLRDARGGTAA